MILFCLCTAALLAGPGDDREESLSILGRTAVSCAACRRDFTGLVCVRSNTRGGVDRDLFARALGPQPEFYRVLTCPHCGYSGYLSDFGPQVTLPPEVLDLILRTPRLALPPGFTAQSDPRDLDPAVRYSLAIRCYEWRRKSDEALAWLHLRASWIERENGALLPADPRLKRVLEYIERWRPPIGSGENQLDVEMHLATRTAEAVASGRFNRYQRPYVDLALALILRRHGENIQAGALLKRLLKADAAAFSAELRAGLSAMQASIAREQEHQRQAAAAFERALLADLVSAENRPSAMYLLGELCRRLGRETEADNWLGKALAEPSIPADLRAWTAEQRQLCRAEKPSSAQ